MVTNLTYWYFPNIFPREELLQLHDIFAQKSVEDVKDEAAVGVTKIARVKMSLWNNFKVPFAPLEQAFLRVNQDNFGYNIWPQYDANYVRLNEYSSQHKGEYGWHCDGSNSATYDIKFTMLVNASLEPYQGGKFVIFGNTGEQEVKELEQPGNVVILKSNIPHKVTPVTKGKRHSIVLFYSGPRFQ